MRLAAAIEGAQRSAELTRQLLSFGRRQALKPVPTNVNDFATRMRDLLRRSLPHDIDIDVIERPELCQRWSILRIWRMQFLTWHLIHATRCREAGG